jgi:uncharacterized membrane protein
VKNLRTIVKAGVWEVISFLVQTVILWKWFGSLPQSITINIILLVIKTILLSIYLKLWKKTGAFKDG